MTDASAVTLAGEPCATALLTVPGAGLWYASVELASAAPLSGAVELRMLDTDWQGTVIAGGVVDGRARYRIVAGAGGWGKELNPRAYANDAGVQAARLIADAASEAGEPPPAGAPATTVSPLGVHFIRPKAPGSFLLNTLAPRAWYAELSGAVAFGVRAAPAQAHTLPTVRRDPLGRSVELAAVDTLAGVLPGAATEYGTAVDVEIELGPTGVRARLYAAPAGTSRRAAALLRLLDATDPTRRFRAVWEYRIVTQVAERLNLQPVRTRADMPDLARVPVRAGAPGVRAQHALGSRVLVAFVDGDPSRPAVVGFEDPSQPGWMPLSLELGGPGALGVARQTDAVQAGPFAGVITGGSLRVKAVL